MITDRDPGDGDEQPEAPPSVIAGYRIDHETACGSRIIAVLLTPEAERMLTVRE